jgi:nitrate/nitrite transporter NarK
MFTLIFAGEMIFSLPFHIARFFRPSMLIAFNLNNTQLGDIFFFYGLMAMIAYFPGGIIADRFSPRKLMSISLFATAFGGIVMLQLPGQIALSILFAYWGLTTIFLFWSAMIKATRLWGGTLEQGKAFGFLDGGRGLIAAIISTLAVFVISNIFPENVENLNNIDRQIAMKSVIWLYTALTTLAGLMIWIFIPESINSQTNYKNPFKGIKKILFNKKVWLQAIIVVSAYSAYKGLDYYSLYVADILGKNELEASRFVSNASYLRPLGAIAAGLIVDKLNTKKVITALFIILIICYSLISISQSLSLLILTVTLNILISFTAVYGLRGVYFVLVAETNIPLSYTGTAIGLISVIGFTPDVFFNSMAGRILDNNPGIIGYQNYFITLALFSLAGLVAILLLKRKSKTEKHNI